MVQALGTWVEESTLKRLQRASYYSIMADECTDITTVEELSVFCRWEEDGLPVEHFLEIIHLRKADAESIHSALIECLKQKNLQVKRMVGMGFDGASTFSGKKTGVQARMKKLAPHALFVHCHCHLLQLACVQAANSTPGIKHVYVTLTALWKCFHYSPKRTQSLKDVQSVLDLPELKVIKPSDTHWLAHERCVKGVKASYAAIVTALDNIHADTHQPEALGLSKALSKQTTIAAIFLLDYTLPQVDRAPGLVRHIQSCRCNPSHAGRCSFTSSKLGTRTIGGMCESGECNWYKNYSGRYQDIPGKGSQAIFISHLIGNVSSRFASSGDVVSALSIFDPRKVPCVDSDDLSCYGEDSVSTLLAHYGIERSAETLDGEETVKEAMITPDISTEWKTFRRYMSKQPKDNLQLQLKDLASNEMMKTMFPNLSTLATISLSIPVATCLES